MFGVGLVPHTQAPRHSPVIRDAFAALVTSVRAAQPCFRRMATDYSRDRDSNDPSLVKGIVVMSIRMIVLMGFLAALWVFGLIGQTYSAEAAMRYLVLSLALVAVAVWRMQPRPALLRRRVDRRRLPPE